MPISRHFSRLTNAVRAPRRVKCREARPAPLAQHITIAILTCGQFHESSQRRSRHNERGKRQCSREAAGRVALARLSKKLHAIFIYDLHHCRKRRYISEMMMAIYIICVIFAFAS